MIEETEIVNLLALLVLIDFLIATKQVTESRRTLLHGVYISVTPVQCRRYCCKTEKRRRIRLGPFIKSSLYSFRQQPLALLGPGCPLSVLIALLFIFFFSNSRQDKATIRGSSKRCLVNYVSNGLSPGITNIGTDRSNETVS